MSGVASHALVTHKGKLLLMLRDNIPSIDNPNKWALIGGVVEDDETPEEGMFREAEEEISVRPQSCEYLGELITEDEVLHKLYLIRLDDQEAENIKLGNEGQKLQFFKFEELQEISLPDVLRDHFQEYSDQIKFIISGGMISDPSDLGFS